VTATTRQTAFFSRPRGIAGTLFRLDQENLPGGLFNYTVHDQDAQFNPNVASTLKFARANRSALTILNVSYVLIVTTATTKLLTATSRRNSSARRKVEHNDVTG